MENFILSIIEKRIKALGFSECSYESFPVILNELLPEQKIYGQNEYYFLCTQTIIEGTTIFADNDFLIADGVTTASLFDKVKEFTGNITIITPQGTRQVLEFLRVIPQM